MIRPVKGKKNRKRGNIGQHGAFALKPDDYSQEYNWRLGKRGDEQIVGAKYFSAHLHLHSSFESAASMEGHCFQAKNIGVDVVWLTDHGGRICWKWDEAFWKDDFERKQLCVAGKKRYTGWRVEGLDDGLVGEAEPTKDFSFSGKQSMRIWSRSNHEKAEWESMRVDFSTDGKKHQRSLITGISFSLALRPERGFGENGRLRIRVELSQQPPNMVPETMTYVLGASGEDDGLISLGDINVGEWNLLSVDLTKDSREHAKGGIDNVFGGLSLFLDSRRGELIELYVDDFQLEQAYNCQSAHDRQKQFAADLSARYGVPVHVGIEMSIAGKHQNIYGSWISILDRNLKPEGYSRDEALAHIKSQGGAISLNHPFSKWKRQDLTDKQREQIVQNVLESCKENRCYNADLLEVGFPEGRHGFTLQQYLRLWDGLSSAGVVIGGIGTSDAHNNRSGWESGNNFANWIRSETTNEVDLICGLLSGDVYMGDPTVFRGELEFVTTEGYRMGQIVVGEDELEVQFYMNGCRPGWKVRWIQNGTQKKAFDVVNEDSWLQGVVNSRDFGFTRFEVYNPSGRCILLTNPIYFVKRKLPGLPSHRIAIT